MSGLDWGTVPQWIAAGVAVVSLLASFAAWVAMRSRAPLEEIQRVETLQNAQHGDVNDRLARLETSLRHALTKTDLGDLYTIARKTEAEVAAVKSELRGLAQGQRDITNLILQRGIEK